MLPNIETVAKALGSIIALDDCYSRPDERALEQIKEQGLEHLIPPEPAGLQEEELLRNLAIALSTDYLTPNQFLEYLQREEENAPLTPVEPFKALNYLLLKEVLKLAPDGEVSDLVCNVAMARVSSEVGLDNLRRILDRKIREIEDPDLMRFQIVYNDCMMRRQRRLVEHLAVIERIIEQAGGDISKVGSIEIFSCQRSYPENRG